MFALYNATTDRNIDRVYLCGVGLMFIKDYLPDGTPCWRLPTEEEMKQYKEKRKHEI